MEDTDYQPLSGEPGMPGSQYRLSQRKGKMVFVATVVRRELPHVVEVVLEAPALQVSVTGTFKALSPSRTELTSEEVFHFKGAIQKIFGVFALPAIRAAHRRQMQSFKEFAERQAK